MVSFDAGRLVKSHCANETSISQVLSEISAFEVPILVSFDISRQCHVGAVRRCCCCSDLLLPWTLFTCLVDAEESRRVCLSARCCFCHRHGLHPPPKTSPKTSAAPATRTSPPLLLDHPHHHLHPLLLFRSHRLPSSQDSSPSDKYSGRLL